MPVLLQGQGRQGVSGAQLRQLVGQHIPLRLKLGLGALAALELLLGLLQPLALAQQVHPGDGMQRGQPLPPQPPPRRPPAPHRSPGLSPCSSPWISACSSRTRCSLLLTVSVVAASSPRWTSGCKRCVCWVGAEP